MYRSTMKRRRGVCTRPTLNKVWYAVFAKELPLPPPTERMDFGALTWSDSDASANVLGTADELNCVAGLRCSADIGSFCSSNSSSGFQRALKV